ncbi:MAG: trimeric intracellular cation channel family protein [Aquiluna sp.]|nr:trimeric intracellular cation channel family protein [Aquiluna sp.]MDP5025440.1 trimeric intracellular cation channel family protein [Aquiluna sp.]
MNLDTLLLSLEAIGVVAFALSGIIEAARKHFDLVGVVMVGFIAAFGGGTLRDVLLDRRPFFWVEQEFWVWVLIGIGVALPFFFKARHMELTEKAMLIPDAVGLGAFAAGGTHIALQMQVSPLIAVLMGVITAVVGGVLRDVLVNEVPRAFHDHQPYAVIAFAGGWLVVLLSFIGTPEYLDVLIAAVLMIALRLLAVKFGWELKRWRFL